MNRLILEGHLCRAGDGYECSYLMLNGDDLDRMLHPCGTKVGNRKVKRLPGALKDADDLYERLQWDYGPVRMTIEFLNKEEENGQ